jgi:hypothetical protein
MTIQPKQLQRKKTSAMVKADAYMEPPIGSKIKDVLRVEAVMDKVVQKIVPTPDDSGGKREIWKSYKDAINYYGLPGSNQIGSWGNSNGILRSYSRSSPNCDRVLNGGREIHYFANDVEKFHLNLTSGQKVRFFRKVALVKIGKEKQLFGVKDMGLYRVTRIYDFNCVQLLQD